MNASFVLKYTLLPVIKKKKGEFRVKTWSSVSPHYTIAGFIVRRRRVSVATKFRRVVPHI